MAKVKKYIKVMAMAFEVEMRQNLTDGFVIFGIIIQPLIVAFMALWMLKGQGPGHAIFVVVGSGMTGLWTTLLFNGGHSITGERWTGTLEPLVASPASLRLIVYGKVLANVTQSLLSMAGCYTLISLILGYPLTLVHPWLFFISLIFTVFCAGQFWADHRFLLYPGAGLRAHGQYTGIPGVYPVRIPVPHRAAAGLDHAAQLYPFALLGRFGSARCVAGHALPRTDMGCAGIAGAVQPDIHLRLRQVIPGDPAQSQGGRYFGYRRELTCLTVSG